MSLKRLKRIKFLGLVMDSGRTWSNHVDTLSKFAVEFLFYPNINVTALDKHFLVLLWINIPTSEM